LFATRRPEITFVRDQVPEFEPAFQEELRLEEGEMDPFQAMSLLARWVVGQLGASNEIPASVRRAFAAVERVYADHAFRLGGDLGVEFLEAICQHRTGRVAALDHMGQRVRGGCGTSAPSSRTIMRVICHIRLKGLFATGRPSGSRGTRGRSPRWRPATE